MMASYDELKERFEELGFDISKHVNTWQIKKKVDEMVGEISPVFKRDLSNVIAGLTRLSETINPGG